MTLLDVNILVYAHKSESPFYPVVSPWLESFVNSNRVFALTDTVMLGFIRIVTHPRIYEPPSRVDVSLNFIQELLERPNCIVLKPGARHWQLFSNLCVKLNARGNAVPDVHLAALALEADCDFVSADRGFGRVPGLRWHNPLDSSSSIS